MTRTRTIIGLTTLVLAAIPQAGADVRVQDIARLQGQRTNKLMGYGLVVGLNGTGDGAKYLPTMRALMRLHERYHAPVLTDADLSGNNSVALVAVEATIPENGARAGQALDVTVSVIGAAKSLVGGQLLTTPLQYAMFDENDPSTQLIMGLAGGAVAVLDEKMATRGFIRDGATLEEDFFYTFIDGDRITLVLDDSHSGWQWAHVVARAVNHELVSPAEASVSGGGGRVRQVVESDYAVAVGPKNVVVSIPPYELSNPANFISRVLRTPLFMLPEQAARVVIDRKTKSVSFTGAVTVSPTILQIPGLGTVMIGQTPGEKGGPLNDVDAVGFGELLKTLSAVKVTPEQLVSTIEQLHRTGTLHAQLHYE